MQLSPGLFDHFKLDRVMPFFQMRRPVEKALRRILIRRTLFFCKAIGKLKHNSCVLIGNPFGILFVRRIQNVCEQSDASKRIIDKISVKNKVVAFYEKRPCAKRQRSAHDTNQQAFRQFLFFYDHDGPCKHQPEQDREHHLSAYQRQK